MGRATGWLTVPILQIKTKKIMKPETVMMKRETVMKSLFQRRRFLWVMLFMFAMCAAVAADYQVVLPGFAEENGSSNDQGKENDVQDLTITRMEEGDTLAVSQKEEDFEEGSNSVVEKDGSDAMHSTSGTPPVSVAPPASGAPPASMAPPVASAHRQARLTRNEDIAVSRIWDR